MNNYYEAIEILKNSYDYAERLKAAELLYELIDKSDKMNREIFGLKTTISNLERKIFKQKEYV